MKVVTSTLKDNTSKFVPDNKVLVDESPATQPLPCAAGSGLSVAALGPGVPPLAVAPNEKADSSPASSLVQNIGTTTTEAPLFRDPFVKGRGGSDSIKPEGDKPVPQFVDPLAKRRKRFVPTVFYYGDESQSVACMDCQIDEPSAQPALPPPARTQPAERVSWGSDTSTILDRFAPRPDSGPAVQPSILPDLSKRKSWTTYPVRYFDGMLSPFGPEFYVNNKSSNSSDPPMLDPIRHGRRRRGLLNIVGKAESWLFGTMSNDDRERIDGEMAKMGRQMEVVSRIGEEFASKLNVTLKTLKEHDGQINNLIVLAQTKFDNLKADSTLSSSLRSVHATVAAIRTKLLKILVKLKEKLKPTGLKLPVPPTMADIHIYYGVIMARPFLAHQRLTLFLHVPLVAADRVFTLYKSIPWPYRVNVSDNKDLFSFYKPESAYIAVNADLSVHLLLSESEVAKCRTSELRVCSPTTAQHSQADSCSMALLTSDERRVKANCVAYFIHQPQDRFVGYGHGTAWAFSLESPAKLSIQDDDVRNSTLAHAMGSMRKFLNSTSGKDLDRALDFKTLDSLIAESKEYKAPQWSGSYTPLGL
ncbi:Envelope fusion protein [Frankliniella fusca]|uniref:Envelope fusion protein n=1 Tax=Frankliniella fusca TaxID=407009 RepID=A0AAE1LJD1_9NEOP|nr:Envelope fusion protein [Frankliniella fusca]